MSLNNIELNPRLLSDLFANTLVETNSIPLPAIKPSPSSIKYLGENRKQILVVVSYDTVPFLPDNALAFLTNILSACRLSMADIAIINRNTINSEELPAVIAQWEASIVLLFGVDPLSIGLPMNFPQFQLQQFNKRTYLYCPTLSELESDKAVKSRLWNCLKNLFGL